MEVGGRDGRKGGRWVRGEEKEREGNTNKYVSFPVLHVHLYYSHILQTEQHEPEERMLLHQSEECNLFVGCYP